MSKESTSPFNSALETGIRTLAILVASYPKAHDLGRLVQYDYLAVHSADAGGPASLHPPLPLRSGELLVRRDLVQAGLRLTMSRSLVGREPHTQGILYRAEEAAGAFFDNMRSPYIVKLRSRAEWVASAFDDLEPSALDATVNRLFEVWTTEFQPVQLTAQGDFLQ